MSNAIFHEDEINWKFDGNNHITIFNNDKHQIISKWAFPHDEAQRIKMERGREVDIKQKKKLLSELLTVNCTSRFKDNHWIITFKNDIDF